MSSFTNAVWRSTVDVLEHLHVAGALDVYASSGLIHSAHHLQIRALSVRGHVDAGVGPLEDDRVHVQRVLVKVGNFGAASRCGFVQLLHLQTRKE